MIVTAWKVGGSSGLQAGAMNFGMWTPVVDEVCNVETPENLVKGVKNTGGYLGKARAGDSVRHQQAARIVLSRVGSAAYFS